MRKYDRRRLVFVENRKVIVYKVFYASNVSAAATSQPSPYNSGALLSTKKVHQNIVYCMDFGCILEMSSLVVLLKIIMCELDSHTVVHSNLGAPVKFLFALPNSESFLITCLPS